MRKIYIALLALLMFTVSVAAVPANQVHLSTTSDPSNSVTVTWQTYDSAPASTVEYGTTPSLGSTIAALQYQYNGYSYYMYNATLSGLTPATTYYYRVGDGVEWSDNFSFTTAPLVGSATPFTAVAWGDQGYGNTAIPPAAASINPQLALIAGDLAYSSDEENVDLYFDSIQLIASKAFFMASPGNHEYSEFGNSDDNLTAYVNRFAFPANGRYSYLNERTYSINYGNAHFVFLDLGRRAGEDDDPVNSEDVKLWLQSDLATVPSGIKWKIVVLHFNLYSSSNSHPMRDAQRERTRFEPVFRNFGVDLVVQGHVHNYERTYPLADLDVATDSNPANVVFETDYINPSYPVYLVAGTGGNCCYDLGDSPAWSVSNLQERGYVKLTFSNNTLAEEFRSPSHVVLDRFTIVKDSNAVEPPSPPGQPPASGDGTSANPTTVPAPLPNTTLEFTFTGPSSASLFPGQGTTLYLTGTQVQGMQTSAALSVSCPSGITCSLGASASAFNFSIPLFISTSPTNPTGVYTVVVNATSGSLSKSVSISLTLSLPGACVENWQCTEWSSCVNDVQTRSCVDANSCGFLASRPSLTTTCGQCTEQWQCTSPSSCVNGGQSRACTDLNQCGTVNYAPQEEFQCGALITNLPLDPSVTQGSPVVAQTQGENGSILNSVMATIVSFFSWVSNLIR